MRKHLMYTGLCLSLFAFAAGVPSAQAQQIATEDVTVDIVIPMPDLDIATPLSFGGEYFAKSATSGTQASSTVSPAGLQSGVVGAPGAARLIPVDIVTVPPTAMNIVIGGTTQGIPSAQMSFRIEDDTTPGQAFILMSDGVSPNLRVDTWVISAVSGVMNTFSATTGIGTMTLDGTGAAEFDVGATMRTLASATAYAAGTYTGTVRVTINY